jgi:hypothetical protein
MAHQILDRVQETTTSTGAGALTLAGATTRMLSLSAAGLANGDTFWGLIEHTTAAEWEIALCTYSTSGPSITRATPLKSSNAGAAVNFSAGTKTVSLVAPASKAPYADNNGVFIFTGPAQVKGFRESVAAPAIAANVLTLDIAAATLFAVSLNADVTTLTINGAAAAMAHTFMIELTADGTPRAFTMPGSVTVINGTYTPTSTASKRDLLSFFTLDGGTTWRCLIVAQAY